MLSKKVFPMTGQTLIELIVALGVASVVLMAITISVISALSGIQFSRNQNQATQYAQEGLEYIRQLRDSDYIKFKNIYIDSGGETYCLTADKTMVPGACTFTNIIDGKFMREIKIQKQGATCNGVGEIKISSAVKWTDGKCNSSANYCHQSLLVQCLSDYKEKKI